ncbi:hypothetical protein GCM10010910_01570 [Microbacterium nanhaiense]|uniref:Uncharacterized protein n=1 Tax=Microbacterium nanhaiense TaxID=1301026 RepID=A0ABQ2MWR0_9MICO|nr:hypothetical protein [Microbacterium nanhaiense]GGO59190.1 hypothetical protein GCM10010910_01570 [Microbacterium nanhaiense]
MNEDPGAADAPLHEEVPLDAEVDVPPNEVGTLEQEKDPDGTHWRFLDRWKHKFAFLLIAACMVWIVFFALIDHIWPRDGMTFSATSDTLKIIATTAMGFVFGQAVRK